MVRYLHKNRFVVVQETAELPAATIVFFHSLLVLLVVEARRPSRSVASWPQQQVLTHAGAMEYTQDRLSSFPHSASPSMHKTWSRVS